MREAVGIEKTDDLFSDIDGSLRVTHDEKIPDSLSEFELREHVRQIAKKNLLPARSFLGGGAYRHFIPATVNAVLSRGEFSTSYTPYQPEVSQGNLQAIWEYQSMMAALLEMDVSNASLYDGATAAAEAMLMCVRSTGRREILVSRTVHPYVREVIATYAIVNDLIIRELQYENGVTSLRHLSETICDETAGVILQSPNFFGIIEDYSEAEKIIHRKNALLVGSFTEALAFGMLKPPGGFQADIACGEGQSLGVPLSFGGPGLGIIASSTALVRKLPGRIAGRTVDTEGRQGFVLTLQAREQHIRREGSTSNICSNHALCALAAAVYLATLGKEGVRTVAELNYHKAHDAKAGILSIGKGSTTKFSDVFPGPFFNEFVVRTPHAQKLIDTLSGRSVAAGIPLEPFYPELIDCLLVTVTEVHAKADIDRLIGALA